MFRLDKFFPPSRSEPNQQETEEEKNKKEKEEEEEREGQQKIFDSGFVAREHLEQVKIEKGQIGNAEFRNFEYTKENLTEELDSLTVALLAENKTDVETNHDFENILLLDLHSAIAEKTKLPLEEIREIYRQNQESLVAEAQMEINASTSAKTKIAKTLLKSGLYVGAGILAGTSAAATLGIGGLFGASAIAGARVLDRMITEKIGRKKLDAKVEEVKKRKTEEDKRAIQNRLAAAISLKKKLEIEKVNLSAIAVGQTADREGVINKYIEEQAHIGSLEVEPDKMEDYKKKMSRVLIGLDDVDRLNTEKETEINQTTWFDKLKKIEDKLAGDTPEKKIISTAALIGAGLAARQIPIIRQILTGYAGWKLGGALIDARVKKDNKEDIIDEEGYTYAKTKLMDRNFKDTDPEGYLRLKRHVEDAEINRINSTIDGAKELNDDLEEHLFVKKNEKILDNYRRYATRVISAVAGVLLGEGIKDVTHILQTHGASEAVPEVRLEIEPEKIQPDLVNEQSAETGAFKPDSTAVDALAEKNAPVGNVFEDVISNAELKSGQHDSVWRSTEQLFKDNAEKLGYQGDLDDQTSLKHWAEAQTAKAINNSGEITDKVFEGNKVILEQNANGDYQIKVEQGEGDKPGILEPENDIEKVDNKVTEEPTPEPENIKNETLDEATGSIKDTTGEQTAEIASLSGQENNTEVTETVVDNYDNSSDDSTLEKTDESAPNEALDNQVEIHGEAKFNLNDDKSFEKLFNTNPDELYQQLRTSDLKNVEWKFDPKYGAAEQLKIKNYVIAQILETQEEQKILEQYQAQYGDRPQFAEFRRLVEHEIATDKEFVIKTIKNCADSNSNISTIGNHTNWHNGSYKGFAEQGIDVAVSKSRLISLQEQAEILSKELP